VYYNDDGPGMDPDLWDDRSDMDDTSDIDAADDAATALAVRLMREMMGDGGKTN
jgi:hypothetical protein